MSEYKIGDIIKLRDDLQVGIKYGGVTLTEFKECFKYIKLKICDKETNTNTYLVMDMEGMSVWISGDMIEGLWEECSKLKLIDILNMITKGELKTGTKVILHTGMYKGENHQIIDLTYKANDLLTQNEKNIFNIMNLNILNDECEIIEPSCEHEWEVETLRNTTGNVRVFRKCVKCGLKEEAKYTDKIGELNIEFKNNYTIANENAQVIADITTAILKMRTKLNEVIRVINKKE